MCLIQSTLYDGHPVIRPHGDFTMRFFCTFLLWDDTPENDPREGTVFYEKEIINIHMGIQMALRLCHHLADVLIDRAEMAFHADSDQRR